MLKKKQTTDKNVLTLLVSSSYHTNTILLFIKHIKRLVDAIGHYFPLPLFTSQRTAAWFLSQQPSGPTLAKAASQLLSAESSGHVPALSLSGLLFCIWHFCCSPFQNLPTLLLP